MYKIKKLCPICQSEETKTEVQEIKVCSICGKDTSSSFTCSNHHTICYKCEQEKLKESIINYCLTTKSKHPLDLTLELMKLPNIPMHGPIHHFLIPAALLTAYSNQTDSINLKDALTIAKNRSQIVPGAVCGLWGVCGSAIGVGIYYSILKEISPLSTDLWKEVGQITSNTANKISNEGGPRCCKRDGFIAINEAIKYSNQYLNTNYTLNDITCDFFINNQQCKNIKCPYFPTKNNRK